MIRYVDTSALLPYYRPEPLSEACERELLASADGAAVSDLTGVEVASALSRLVRTQELEERHANAIWNRFSADLDGGRFVRLSLGGDVFRRAREWLLARDSALRSLDALHLAVAATAGAELLTADAGFAKAAGRLGVPTRCVV